MRCLAGKQPGLVFPFVPGYSQAGRIVAVGEGVALEVGTPVFCTGTIKANVPLAWGGHVSHAVQNANDVYPIPDGVDLLDASITKIAAIPYHGVRLSHPAPHETIIVIGLGIIGQFSARLHALTGAKVLGVDLSEERVALLRSVGVDAVTSIEDAQAILPDGADVIVDATGANGIVPSAIALANELPWDDSHFNASRYVVQGSYPEDFCIPYQAAFQKRLTFLLPRDAQPRDFRTVLDFIKRDKLKVRDTMTEVVKPSDAPRIYRALQNREIMTAVFQWHD